MRVADMPLAPPQNRVLVPSVLRTGRSPERPPQFSDVTRAPLVVVVPMRRAGSASFVVFAPTCVLIPSALFLAPTRRVLLSQLSLPQSKVGNRVARPIDWLRLETPLLTIIGRRTLSGMFSTSRSTLAEVTLVLTSKPPSAPPSAPLTLGRAGSPSVSTPATARIRALQLHRFPMRTPVNGVLRLRQSLVFLPPVSISTLPRAQAPLVTPMFSMAGRRRVRPSRVLHRPPGTEHPFVIRRPTPGLVTDVSLLTSFPPQSLLSSTPSNWQPPKLNSGTLFPVIRRLPAFRVARRVVTTFSPVPLSTPFRPTFPALIPVQSRPLPRRVLTLMPFVLACSMFPAFTRSPFPLSTIFPQHTPFSWSILPGTPIPSFRPVVTRLTFLLEIPRALTPVS